tara:strand:- start:545 stop:976 length:432 start_codon:yes stop_codon:yes gene_type:complete
MKPIAHFLVTIILVFGLFFFEGKTLITLPLWLFLGVIFGVGIDFDHLFLALIFNWKIAKKDILSFNPMRLYHNFLNGQITNGDMNFDQYVIYYSLHIIWIILINLLVNLYYPNFFGLSLLVTGVHYFMDLLRLFPLQLKQLNI